MKRLAEIVGAACAVCGWVVYHPTFLDFFWFWNLY